MSKSRPCKEKGCGMMIVFLFNPDTEKMVPVDMDSLNRNELTKVIRGENFNYERGRHVSHYKTCKNPDRFSKKKTARREIK